MERSARPRNLSSSRKHAIMEWSSSTARISRRSSDISSTLTLTLAMTPGGPCLRNILAVNALRSFSNALSLSSSAQSDEVVRVLSNACVRSEVSRGSESIRSPVPRKYFMCAHQIDQGCQAAKWVDRTSYDPRFFRTSYRDRHTCKNLILKSPQLIVDSPSARDDSIPLSFNTSLFAEQDDENNPIFFDFLSVNQEQKLPSEDDVNPPRPQP
ncbi:hypothetical protein NL676_018807 [Syzygium grande]|nr:hypothetical protein NL676_018807 [Syzygium grande]